MQSLRISVSGRVQGVGFRYSALQAAARYRVRGWVRNEYDGTVSIRCEGEEDQCKRFVAWCRKGPSMARVDEVVVHKAPVEGFTRFSIQ